MRMTNEIGDSRRCKSETRDFDSFSGDGARSDECSQIGDAKTRLEKTEVLETV